MTTAKTKELTITRILHVPRERVWHAWTNADTMKQWWGPKRFTSPEVRIDLRVRGKYLAAMKSPEGQVFWSTGRYHEIKEPEKLMMSDSFADEKGNVVPATYYGMGPDFPLELQITVTLEDQAGKTKMTLHHTGIEGVSQSDLENMKQGWEESFDKLADYLGESRNE